MKNWLLTDGLRIFKNLEKLVCMYGSNGYSVGSSLTWSDFYLFEMVLSVGKNLPEFEKNFPLVHGVYQKVGDVDELKTYLADRPVTKI
jgi:hypothetical protein